MILENPSQNLRQPLRNRFRQLVPVGLAICFLSVSTAASWGQITEATAEPPPLERPEPRFPQLPGDDADIPPVKNGPEKVIDNTRIPEIVARIKSIDGRKLTLEKNDNPNIRMENPKPIVVTVADKATVTLNRKPATVADLKPNDFVRITPAPANPDLAITVAAARVVRDTPPSEPAPRTRRPLPDRTRDNPRAMQQGGLGVVVADSPNEGIVVLEVERKTPAWNAGIQTGDFLLKFDKKDIVTPEDFLTTVRAHEPGEQVRLVLWRKGKTRTGNVELTTREIAQDREAVDVRAHITAETHGDDTVVIKRTPGRTETLDREPEDSTIVLDREPDGDKVIVAPREEIPLPAAYDELAKEHRELQKRVAELERQLNQLKK